MDFMQFYQEGGMFMHPITLLGLLAVPVGLLAAVLRVRALGITALLLGGLCLVVGVLAFALGVLDVEAAVQTVVPEQYEAARARGMQVVRIPLVYAAAWSAPALVLGALGLRRARQRAAPP